MKRLLAALLLLASCSFAHAQDAYVVAICGAVPSPYTNVGAVLPITVDTNGKLCLSGGGGGGTPGGSNTQLQYNAAGSFGGISGATSNGTTVTFASSDLILSGATSGSAILNAPATGGGTLTLPAGSTTLAGLSVAETWTAIQTFNSGDLVLGGIASTQCLQANSSGVISGTGSTCGAGTVTGSAASPQVTFWNGASSITGDASFTFTAPGQATLALGSITTNLKALTITGTFNASGTTFDAPLLVNITNTASNSSSLLADLQIGGSTFWDVNVSGQTQQAGLAWIKTQTGGVAFGNAFDASLSYAGANTLSVDNGNFNTATGTLKLANIVLTTSITGPNNNGTNGAGSNITETPALSTGGGAPGNWIVQNGFTGTGAAGTATISNASPAVITEASHNYFVGEPFTLTTTGTLPTGFSTLTTYYIISAGFGAGAFEASTSFGGAAVNTSTAGSGTHTVNPGGVVTISNASPAVITLNNHGLVPGMQVQFATTGALPTGLSTATNYFVLAAGLTVNAFEVSTTLNGTAVNTSSAGSGTQTVLYQGGTVQNPAYAVGTWGPSQLTDSLTTSALLINQVWNTQGVPDAAFAINVTNVGQVAGSLMADWQIGGKSFFQFGMGQPIDIAVGNAGGPNSAFLAVYNNNGATFDRGGFDWSLSTNTLNVGTYSSTGAGRNISISVSNGKYAGTNQTGSLVNTWAVQAGNSFGWSSTNDPNTGAVDVNLIRNGAAGILGLINNNAPTTATGFRIYNTIDNAASPTNYERLVADFTTTANVGTIATQAGGTGLKRPIQISSANGHTSFIGGTAPTANSCAGFALGTGSSDGQGTVTYTSATTCSITFGTAYTNSPFCTVMPGTAASTVLGVASTTGLAITFGTAQTTFSYHCTGT